MLPEQCRILLRLFQEQVVMQINFLLWVVSRYSHCMVSRNDSNTDGVMEFQSKVNGKSLDAQTRLGLSRALWPPQICPFSNYGINGAQGLLLLPSQNFASCYVPYTCLADQTLNITYNQVCTATIFFFLHVRFPLPVLITYYPESHIIFQMAKMTNS